MAPASRIGATLASIVLAATAIGCGGSSPTPTYVVATSSPTAAASATATPTAAPVAGAWTLVPAVPALANVSLNNVVWTGERFVAAANSDDGVRFFASTDGSAWTPQGSAYPDTLAGGLASGSGGLVAVGAYQGRMTSWHSNDGLSWLQAPDAASLNAPGDNEFQLGAVAAVGGGWIAVGGEYAACMGDVCNPLRAVVWTSSDGWNWAQAPATPALANAFMEGIAPWKSGYVAVGWAGMYATVWTSPMRPSGRSWPTIRCSSRPPERTRAWAPARCRSCSATGFSWPWARPSPWPKPRPPWPGGRRTATPGRAVPSS